MREPNINLRLEGRIHARSSRYRHKRDQAIGFAMAGFERSERPYLALSGGKDSVAMLAVVEAAALILDRNYVIWSHVSDASFPGTEETILECAEKVNRKLILDRSPISAFDVIGQQSRQQFGKTGYFFEAIARQCEVHDLAFVGVRADESKRRKHACRAHGPIFESMVPRPHIKCQPICWFTIWDVAAAIHEAGLPIHPIYDKHPTDTACIRLGYITALDLVEKGTVSFLRMNYPEQFRRLCEVWPETRKMV